MKGEKAAFLLFSGIINKKKLTFIMFFSVQSQLNICKKEKCYFIVYVNDKIPLFVEKIERDEKLWENTMLPILLQFYKECVGPELIRGNLRKGKRLFCVAI